MSTVKTLKNALDLIYDILIDDRFLAVRRTIINDYQRKIKKTIYKTKGKDACHSCGATRGDAGLKFYPDGRIDCSRCRKIKNSWKPKK